MALMFLRLSYVSSTPSPYIPFAFCRHPHSSLSLYIYLSHSFPLLSLSLSFCISAKKALILKLFGAKKGCQAYWELKWVLGVELAEKGLTLL